MSIEAVYLNTPTPDPAHPMRLRDSGTWRRRFEADQGYTIEILPTGYVRISVGLVTVYAAPATVDSCTEVQPDVAPAAEQTPKGKVRK